MHSHIDQNLTPEQATFLSNLPICKAIRRGGNLKHGLAGTKLYDVWNGMIRRCENPNAKWYKRYGGRGIRVRLSWRRDFLVFERWAVSHGYGKGLTIDRINNDGDYEPDNCRWATWSEQQSNRGSGFAVVSDNETRLLVEHLNERK